MGIKQVVFGIIFLFLLMGCSQEQTIATTATAVPPTNTPIPPTNTPTNTPSPTVPVTVTPLIPTATPIPPTYTPTPTFALSADASTIPITNVILSNQGQLAYIRADILYVESEPQTHLFEAISENAITAAWSPDGSKLVYSAAISPNTNIDDWSGEYEQRLWFTTNKSSVPLSELISGYPVPAHRVYEMHWTPNGNKILLQSNLSNAEFEAHNGTVENKLAVADIELKTYAEIQLTVSNQRIIWLTDDIYILRFHCGSPCAAITAYDYSGNVAWSPYWDTGGFVAFAPNSNFMINVGRIDTNMTDDIPKEPYLPTLDKINLSTGDVEILWERPIRDSYFTPFLMPSISPDERFFSFNYDGGFNSPGTLFIVDQNGNEQGRYENSYALDWRNNDDLMLNQLLETGEHQLQLVSPEGPVQILFTTNPGIEITGNQRTPRGGVWSPDGKVFAFIVTASKKLLKSTYGNRTMKNYY